MTTTSTIYDALSKAQGVSAADISATRLFVVFEGISGSGKSTLAALLAERPGCTHFHTVPTPVRDLQPCIRFPRPSVPTTCLLPRGCAARLPPCP